MTNFCSKEPFVFQNHILLLFIFVAPAGCVTGLKWVTGNTKCVLLSEITIVLTYKNSVKNLLVGHVDPDPNQNLCHSSSLWCLLILRHYFDLSWWCPMLFVSWTSLRGMRLKIKATWKLNICVSFVMFASCFCAGTVCQCLPCGGWNHRSALSPLIAQGWRPWISSTTLQMPAAGQRGLIQRTERRQREQTKMQRLALRTCVAFLCVLSVVSLKWSRWKTRLTLNAMRHNIFYLWLDI